MNTLTVSRTLWSKMALPLLAAGGVLLLVQLYPVQLVGLLVALLIAGTLLIYPIPAGPISAFVLAMLIVLGWSTPIASKTLLVAGMLVLANFIGLVYRRPRTAPTGTTQSLLLGLWSELEDSPTVESVLNYTRDFLLSNGVKSVELHQNIIQTLPNTYAIYALNQRVTQLEVRGVPRHIQLDELLKVVEARLSQIARNQENAFLNYITLELQDAHNLKEGAQQVCYALLSHRNYTSCGVYVYDKNTFRPYAHTLLDAQNVEFNHNLLWKAYLEQRALFTHDEETARSHHLPDFDRAAVAIIPLPSLSRSRAFLVVGRKEYERWDSEEQEFLSNLGRQLGMLIQKQTLLERLKKSEAILSALRSLSLDELNSLLMTAAADLLPGAQYGALLIREDQHYRMVASQGLDLGPLAHVRIPEQDVLVWYGGSQEECLNGIPRIRRLDSSDADVQRIQTDVLQDLVPLAKLQADLCVPIVHEGQMLAFLSLNNMLDKHAFDQDALEVAGLLGSQLAVIVQEAKLRQELSEAAATDPLTGLPNRRALENLIPLGLASLRRSGQPASFLLMDLNGFKAINDHFGHKFGDDILRQVGRSLKSVQRSTDLIFRLGGDEFLAYLPSTSTLEAQQAAERFQTAIQALSLRGFPLGASIGMSLFPDESEGLIELLRIADERMYEQKQAYYALRGKRDA
ncbi:sensor domain-containing diguanylate cyclase [Deinococcus cellulosilyticus]|uniref:GGDEF domain-containing protein n=1 Tax=Deinococcus cellulosilyticus (strain DSM 18568 / NBRC 106333 / KACC 11606 / 5516J-15) TaxID=1223518 RepID=A0A511N4N9_DEIC1|nr:sensor domain-containing diguanylate cyclase [Deinococcus cellulosilyticus]GEM47795.1 hypothetical protein DC3_34300 [Deinococcus cellulosilyticus NBRC 106333 = KACC 11606]